MGPTLRYNALISMIFLPSLLTDVTFTFRNILNHTLTVLKSSEKSKREQKAGLREYGLP